MRTPKISVLMPVYNTKEEYLREAIESILNQTYTDFEFLILDDGSTNNAAEVIRSYKDPRIKYFYHENEGIARTRNRGLELASGKYIAVMDSDDISLPERFEKQVYFLEQNPDVSVLGAWFEIFPQGEMIRHAEKVDFLDMLHHCQIGHSTVMWRKADFEKHGLRYDNDVIVAEDYELWSRAIRVLKFANLSQVLVKYRWEGQNISITKSNIMERATLTVRQNMLAFLTKDRILQKQLSLLIFGTPPITKRRILLFGFIPLFKIKKTENVEKWRLFGVIPFLKIKGRK